MGVVSASARKRFTRCSRCLAFEREEAYIRVQVRFLWGFSAFQGLWVWGSEASIELIYITNVLVV